MPRLVAFMMVGILLGSITACGKRGELRLPQQSLSDTAIKLSAVKSLADGSL